MPDGKLNPLSLSPAEAVQLLSKACGQSINEEMLREAIEAGLPVDNRGNLNLIVVAAWLNSAMGEAGGPTDE